MGAGGGDPGGKVERELKKLKNKNKKSALLPFCSPQAHLRASERALTSSCFFYQAQQISPPAQLDSSVNVGYSHSGSCVRQASPVPLSPCRHPPTSTWPLDKHGFHITHRAHHMMLTINSLGGNTDWAPKGFT